MHFRRLATFLLGAWLAASLLFNFVSVENYRAVDRMLADPGFQLTNQIRALGHDATRDLLRHQAGEQVRWLLEQWERIEIVVGVALLLILLFGTRADKILLGSCTLMILIVLADRFALTPEITRLGRIVDYLPFEQPSVDRGHFLAFQSVYSGLDLLKLGLGFLLGARLLIRGRHDSRRPSSSAEHAARRASASAAPRE